MNLQKYIFLLLAIFSFFNYVWALSENWGNWLGPNYNGAIEENLDFSSYNEEIRNSWKIPVGKGWSAPIIYGGKVFLHDRTDEKENVTAYDIDTGKAVWRYSFDSYYQDDFGMENGPRSTPAISQGILISHSPEGFVHAIDESNGKLKWKADLSKDFGSPKGFFGRCSSPLILENKVLLNVGGKKAGLVAISILSGKTLWLSKPYGNDYASVIPLRTKQGNFIVAFMREGVVVVDSMDGSENYFESFQSPINASVNAASPLVLNRGVFLSSCYEVGAGYWIFSNKHGKIELTNKWKKKGALDCHYSTPVEYENYLYGFHGRQEKGALLRCVRLSDGKVMWTAPPLGSGHLIRVGGRIICLTERGELISFKAKHSGFEVDFRQQILGSGRAHFAYSNGKITARDKRRLICLDLGKTAAN